MLAEELNFEEGTIQLALSSMEELGMIVNDNDFLYITGWEEHQNVEGMDKIREQNRLRKQRQQHHPDKNNIIPVRKSSQMLDFPVIKHIRANLNPLHICHFFLLLPSLRCWKM